MISAHDTREPGGNFVNLGWWNRSGHSGPFIFKTRGIGNKMVRDIGIFGVVLGGGRQQEEKKKEKNTVYRFLPTLQNAQREYANMGKQEGPLYQR